MVSFSYFSGNTNSSTIQGRGTRPCLVLPCPFDRLRGRVQQFRKFVKMTLTPQLSQVSRGQDLPFVPTEVPVSRRVQEERKNGADKQFV